MAWSWGDGFDCYATMADAINGYWDSGNTGSLLIVAGRFAGSQAVYINATASNLVKSSGANDAVHHIAVAFRQTNAITGTTLGCYLQLLDGTTGQCAIVFRSDGAILLTSGTAAGATLATYTGAFPVIATWYAFEFEVVINNTTGRFRVRKNGNTVDDFDSGAVLNTRPGANAYANKLTFGLQAGNTHQLDDLFWRSDASSVAWLGDIRCYTRMPASDASVQFARAPSNAVVAPLTASTPATTDSPNSYYSPFIPAYDGTISAVVVSIQNGFTGSIKCAVFNGTTAGPTTILATATSPIINPATGNISFAFSAPFTVSKGGQYWIGVSANGFFGNALACSSGGTLGRFSNTVGYTAFPAASPTVANNIPFIYSVTIATTTNYPMVSEPQQDATTSYVYDSTPGHADFYGIGSIASTPVSTFMVTTRGYMQKSDAGTRTAAVQLKSGASTVASSTLTLTTSGWTWAWRSDLTDPATGSAWTPAAVNNVQIGPSVVA